LGRLQVYLERTEQKSEICLRSRRDARLAPDDIPVAILLSTYNGQGYLAEQLASLLAQTHQRWTLFWRDDGSTDRTTAIMAAFAEGPGHGRCIHVSDGAHLGITASFFALLRQVPGGHVVAFADQDDVWLPEKLERGLAALGNPRDPRPALYCARQHLVDESLRSLGLSPPLPTLRPFPASLTQNVATGCTVMLNPAATELIAQSRPPHGTLHDWWSYLLVGAAGGALIADPMPVVLYRQHRGNAVGAPHSAFRRGFMALKRGPDPFMRLLRLHAAELVAHSDALSPQARADLGLLLSAWEGSRLARLRVLLRLHHLVRQTRLETLLFRFWFLIA
jgi:glycosyltransferase involved in cell wall biosynthesis